MIERKSWSEFQKAGLLWWINRGLHLFGWCIVFEAKPDGTICDVYPARCVWRGFKSDDEAEGFVRLTEHVAENAERLRGEVNAP